MSEFKINSDQYSNGFSMKFANGYTISVQFAEMNYSNGKTNAEVAAWGEDGNWVHLSDGDMVGEDVIGWQSTNDVAKLMDKVSKLNKKKK